MRNYNMYMLKNDFQPMLVSNLVWKSGGGGGHGPLGPPGSSAYDKHGTVFNLHIPGQSSAQACLLHLKVKHKEYAGFSHIFRFTYIIILCTLLQDATSSLHTFFQ